MSGLHDPDSLAASRACEQAVLHFTALFDAGEYAKMAAFFAEGGVWKRADGDINGLTELRQRMSMRPAGLFVRHVLSNLRTALTDADHALVDSYVTVYRQDFDGRPELPAPLDGPDLVGRYRDAMVREGADWKIARREVQIDFKRRSKE